MELLIKGNCELKERPEEETAKKNRLKSEVESIRRASSSNKLGIPSRLGVGHSSPKLRSSVVPLGVVCKCEEKKGRHQ